MRRCVLKRDICARNLSSREVFSIPAAPTRTANPRLHSIELTKDCRAARYISEMKRYEGSGVTRKGCSRNPKCLRKPSPESTAGRELAPGIWLQCILFLSGRCANQHGTIKVAQHRARISVGSRVMATERHIHSKETITCTWFLISTTMPSNPTRGPAVTRTRFPE
jgi:hypothetical protein